MTRRVAVVTGSNKGIGFAIIRGLCKEFDGDVYLTSRDIERGKQAVEALKTEGLTPLFHQLDITDAASVQRLRDFLLEKYGGLDVLVNNAAIAFKGDATESFAVQASVTLRTNYFAVKDSCEVLFPILRAGARVVNVSSFVSTFGWNKCSANLQGRLRNIGSISELDEIMNEFISAAESDTCEGKGWPKSAYAISKVAVSMLTELQQKEFDADTTRQDVIVNSGDPGFVDTDMTSHKGKKTIDDGADTLLYLATLPPNMSEPKGQFASERKIVVWNA